MTTKTKNPRKSYKTLYLREQHAHGRTRDRLESARHRLAEINAALSPHGQKALEAQNGGDGPIQFAPLEFVAMRAFMEGHARITSEDEYAELTPVNYAWRDRPIFKVEGR